MKLSSKIQIHSDKKDSYLKLLFKIICRSFTNAYRRSQRANTDIPAESNCFQSIYIHAKRLLRLRVES